MYIFVRVRIRLDLLVFCSSETSGRGCKVSGIMYLRSDKGRMGPGDECDALGTRYKCLMVMFMAPFIQIKINTIGLFKLKVQTIGLYLLVNLI